MMVNVASRLSLPPWDLTAHSYLPVSEPFKPTITRDPLLKMVYRESDVIF